MRAITSVGPPAAKPTTMRTDLFGYLCAGDGTAVRTSATSAASMRMGRLLKLVLAAIIRGHAAEDKKKSGAPSPSFSPKETRNGQEADAQGFERRRRDLQELGQVGTGRRNRHPELHQRRRHR